MTRLEQIRRRMDEASPLPWVQGATPAEVKQPNVSKRRKIQFPPDATGFRDAKFVINARADVPYLVGEVDKRQSLLGRSLNHLTSMEWSAQIHVKGKLFTQACPSCRRHRFEGHDPRCELNSCIEEISLLLGVNRMRDPRDEDVCMCGSLMKDHTGWEGHSAVSMREYYEREKNY